MATPRKPQTKKPAGPRKVARKPSIAQLRGTLERTEARCDLAESVAAAALALTRHWATWAYLQAGAIAAAETDQARRAGVFIDGGAADVLEQDAGSGKLAYAALEAMDAALLAWSAHSGHPKQERHPNVRSGRTVQ